LRGPFHPGYNTDPVLSTEERKKFNDSNTNLTGKPHTNDDQFSSNSTKESDFQFSTSVATPPTKSVNKRPNSDHQNVNIMYQSESNEYNTSGSQDQELEKNQSNIIPLKVVVRCYSTKEQKRHRLEEVEANLGSSDSDADESATAE
jgi:hypothetical protein